MSTELDRVLAQLKRLSKTHYESDFTRGYELGLDHAIQVVERCAGVMGAPEADPVIDWPRPSCDRKDTGLRFGDGLKLASVPTLMDDDEPDAA